MEVKCGREPIVGKVHNLPLGFFWWKNSLICWEREEREKKIKKDRKGTDAKREF
jgi:hypothetical protein